MHSVALFPCRMALPSCLVALFPGSIPQEVIETLTLILLPSHLLHISQIESVFQMGCVAAGPSETAAHAISADKPKLPGPVGGIISTGPQGVSGSPVAFYSSLTLQGNFFSVPNDCVSWHFLDPHHQNRLSLLQVVQNFLWNESRRAPWTACLRLGWDLSSPDGMKLEWAWIWLWHLDLACCSLRLLSPLLVF